MEAIDRPLYLTLITIKATSTASLFTKVHDELKATYDVYHMYCLMYFYLIFVSFTWCGYVVLVVRSDKMATTI